VQRLWQILTIKLMGTFRGSTAKKTGVPLGVGFAPARRTIKLLYSYLAIHRPIAAIDLEDLALKILFLQVRALPKKLPHGLAGERKAIDMPPKILERSGGAICLGFGSLGKALCACDFRLLISFPNHGFCGFGFSLG